MRPLLLLLLAGLAVLATACGTKAPLTLHPQKPAASPPAANGDDTSKASRPAAQ